MAGILGAYFSYSALQDTPIELRVQRQVLAGTQLTVAARRLVFSYSLFVFLAFCIDYRDSKILV